MNEFCVYFICGGLTASRYIPATDAIEAKIVFMQSAGNGSAVYRVRQVF